MELSLFKLSEIAIMVLGMSALVASLPPRQDIAPAASIVTSFCQHSNHQAGRTKPEFRVNVELDSHRRQCCSLESAEEKETCVKEFQLLRLAGDSCKENITSRSELLRPDFGSSHDPRKLRQASLRLLKLLGEQADNLQLDTVRLWQADCCARSSLRDNLACYRDHVSEKGYKARLLALFKNTLYNLLPFGSAD